MKLKRIYVKDYLHREIKREAADTGKTMEQYLEELMSRGKNDRCIQKKPKFNFSF